MSQSPGAADVPLTWSAGDRVMDLYEVRQVLGQGGMGLVHRVRHLGWSMDLAVKSPRPELFAGDADKQLFIREAETWVSLGLHPHVCACYYVRTLGGIPRVFAEYVNGGSLHERISDRRLYAGGPEQALTRILDIAIQAAWGLAHAHDYGLVHQDVKPANVLLTADGIAKVTDFGLARIRTTPDRSASALGAPNASSGQSVLVSSGGMTLAYASPEQAAGRPVGRRSDVWSYAVMILEMFAGEVTWMAGPVAGAALADLRTRDPVEADIPTMPDRLADLLSRCLAEDPADRPSEMAEIAGGLAGLYQDMSGRQFARVAPRAVDLRADELTNQALSMLDLDRHDDAVRLFDEALTVDPHHLEATFNSGLLQWRSGVVNDDGFVTSLERVAAGAADQGLAQRLLGQAHLERGDVDAAHRLLKEAARHSADDPEIAAMLNRARSADPRRDRRQAVDLGSLLPGHPENQMSPGERPSMVNGDPLFVGDTDARTDSRVRCAAVSPDGRLVLSGRRDGTITVWSVEPGRLVRTLKGHTDSVSALRVSRDGRFALSGSGDGTVRVWDLDAGRCRQTFTDHHNRDLFSVAEVCMTADRRLVASAGGLMPEIRVWETATGQCLRVIVVETMVVSSVDLTEDGRLAVSDGNGYNVCVWDLASGDCLRTLRGHIDSVVSVRVSGDGRFAVSMDRNRTMRLWDLASGRCLRTLEAPGTELMELSADQRHVLFLGPDRLEAWKRPDPAARVCPFQPCRPRSHTELASHEAQLKILVNQAELHAGEGRFHDALDRLTKARNIRGHERDPRVLEAWRSLSHRTARTGVRGAWQARPLSLSGYASALSVCMSADGRALSTHSDNTLRVWDVVTSELLTMVDVRSHANTNDLLGPVSLSADGRTALAGGLSFLAGSRSRLGKRVWVWDLDTGRNRYEMLLDPDPGDRLSSPSLAVSADGRIAAVSDGPTVLVWDVLTRAARRFRHPGEVFSVSITPDGRFGLFGCPGTTMLWDLATGGCLRTLEELSTAAPPERSARLELARNCSELSPDGRFAIIGDQDQLLTWDLATGEFVRSADGDESRRPTWQAGRQVVTADSRFAVSASGHNTKVLIWDLATGSLVRTLEGHSGPVRSVCVSPDGRHVLATDGPDVRVWEIDWDLEAREPADWDEGARLWLEVFLTSHTPAAGDRPPDGRPAGEQVELVLSRRGTPSWTDADFDGLIRQLQHAGYGWLRREGVAAELERIARDWDGPPPRYE